MVYDAGGKLAAEYAQVTAPTTANIQYVTNNYQGSTSVVTDQAGNVKSRHDYLPFGEEIGAGVGSRTTVKAFNQPDSVRQKYAGMETDTATGMAHTLWRKLDNWSGRWTSPDPYGGSMTTGDPQSFNRYTYCDNDPVNQTDALGLMGSDASQGWSGSNWGGELGMDDPHFGGPGIIGSAEQAFDRDVQDRVDGKLAAHYLKTGNVAAAQRLFRANSNIGVMDSTGQAWGSAAANFVGDVAEYEAETSVSVTFNGANPTFENLWKAHPARNIITDSNGNVPDYLENQCSITMSLALQLAGVDMSSYSGSTLPYAQDGKTYLLARSINELAAWVKERFKSIDSDTTRNIAWKSERVPEVQGSGRLLNDALGRRGILIFYDFWRNKQGQLSGHIDLWNGTDLRKNRGKALNYASRSREVVFIPLN